MIQVSVKTIRVRLELNCGGSVADVFGTRGGKSGSAFSQTYQEYSAQVAQLDANVCFYLKVFSKIGDVSRTFTPPTCMYVIRLYIECTANIESTCKIYRQVRDKA